MQFSSKSTPGRKTLKPALPVDSHLHQVIESLKVNMLVLLEALPGAGKTTRIPPALVGSVCDTVLVLEPRRLAARMAARRVAVELGEELGATVGYQVRFEEVGGRETKLWYVTEGVLTRKLLSGDTLPFVGIIVLDEFHERHLETDLAFSLLLKLQQRRTDLRLLLMSATLGAELRSKLGNPPMIQCPGRIYPVDVSYTGYSASPLEDQVAQALAGALKQTKGDVLIFLPGAAEIRKCMQACESIVRSHSAKLYALHGDLALEEQDRAVKPADHRKVICSTNVAESSITIEGVEAVIDSGLARVLTHSTWSGLSRLQVEKVSQSSVIQRSGRAGRTGPGIAIRLFAESDFNRRPPDIAPEILRSDLCSTFLQVSAASHSWDTLPWLDAPAEANVTQAKEVLYRLNALDKNGAVTKVGSQMAKLPVHPRLARFLISAAANGCAHEAVDVAARLSEARFRSDEQAQSSFASDLDTILASEASYPVKQLRRRLLTALPNQVKPRTEDSNALEKALLTGYPDRIAQRRGEHLFLVNGGSAKVDRFSHAQGDFIIVLEVDDRGGSAVPLVRLGVDIKPDWILDTFSASVQMVEQLIWNRQGERVEQRTAMQFGELTLDESTGPPADRAAATQTLISKALEAGIERFTDAEKLGQFMLRVRFAAEHGHFDIPGDLFSKALADIAVGLISFAELRAACRNDAFPRTLELQLPMRIVDNLAPAFVALPAGRRARIEYHEGRPPSVSSRLQDFFGMKSTPMVADGKVPLVVQLLAPNQRPVQVTTDLVSFWKNLYPQVRRELSRRYPRHSWPESP